MASLSQACFFLSRCGLRFGDRAFESAVSASVAAHFGPHTRGTGGADGGDRTVPPHLSRQVALLCGGLRALDFHCLGACWRRVDKKEPKTAGGVRGSRP